MLSVFIFVLFKPDKSSLQVNAIQQFSAICLKNLLNASNSQVKHLPSGSYVLPDILVVSSKKAFYCPWKSGKFFTFTCSFSIDKTHKTNLR
jgi:hypothetical protein